MLRGAAAGMMDYERARLNMVESQVRPNGVTDRRLLEAMAEVPREAFVPEPLRSIAYMDEDLPLPNGRRITEPMTLARLIDLAAITTDDRVMHVGCATGYAAALLARLAREVVAIEEDAALAEAASSTLTLLGIANAQVVCAELAAGAAARGPFDAVVIEGRVSEMPMGLAGQLRDRGRMVAVLGSAGAAKIALWTRAGESFSCRWSYDAAIAALPGFAPSRPKFQF